MDNIAGVGLLDPYENAVKLRSRMAFIGWRCGQVCEPVDLASVFCGVWLVNTTLITGERQLFGLCSQLRAHVHELCVTSSSICE